MNRLDQLQKMLEEDPKDSFLLFAIAKEHEKTDTLQKAIHYYEKLVENDSNYNGVYYHLGGVYAKLGNTDKAREIYKSGIEVSTKLGDQHAVSELKGVLMNLEID